MAKRRRKLSMGAWYLIILGAVVLGVAAFLIFGGKGEEKAPEPSPTPEAATPTPVPTPTNEDKVLVPYRSDGAWGYKSNTGEIKIEAQFDVARAFVDDMAFVAVERDDALVYGLIDKTGAWVIEPLYSDARDFSEGYAAVCYDGAWGYIEPQGSFITDREFSFAGDFSGGLARVVKNGKYGYIDDTGEFRISNQYDDATDFSEGMAFVGKLAEGSTQMTYYLITDHDETLGAVSIAQGGVFSESLAAVKLQNTKYAYYNRRGRQAFSDTYENAYAFSEGLAAVKTGGMWGYINSTGELVIPAQYTDARSFSEGLAAVKDASGNWGYIDETGAVVIQHKYVAAESFADGYALVQKPLEQGLIDVNDNYKALYVVDAVDTGEEGSQGTERTGTVKADKLNVREEPSTDSDKVTQLEEGDEVVILGESDDWFKISSGDYEGYVKQEYITED